MKHCLLLTLLFPIACLAAEATPRAPCDSEPVPAYAAVGALPAVAARLPKNDTARVIAPCAADLSETFDAVVVLSGRFAFKGDANQLLERLGAISKLRGLRYWSITERSWEVLIPKAHALEKTDKGYAPRGDFSAAEMKGGHEVFYAQSDNRSKRELIYRLRVTATPDRIVAQARNITGFNVFLASVAPGDLRTVQFLLRRGNDTWDYYLVSAVKKAVIGTNEASLINRAHVLYGHASGQQIDAEPPLAP